MQAKTFTQRSAKGSVVILNSHDRLQLRFRFGGKRRYLSLGLPDTPINRKLSSDPASA